jgi:hypothetical protein
VQNAKLENRRGRIYTPNLKSKIEKVKSKKQDVPSLRELKSYSDLIQEGV